MQVKANSVSLLSPFPCEHTHKKTLRKRSPGIQRPSSSSAKESLTSLTNEEIPTYVLLVTSRREEISQLSCQDYTRFPCDGNGLAVDIRA